MKSTGNDDYHRLLIFATEAKDMAVEKSESITSSKIRTDIENYVHCWKVASILSQYVRYDTSLNYGITQDAYQRKPG